MTGVRPRTLLEVFAEADPIPDETALDFSAMRPNALDAALADAAAELAATTRARAKAVTACKRAAVKAHAAGMTEVELAVVMGVNRLTIRRWIGKS
jgi:hypothetical protein